MVNDAMLLLADPAIFGTSDCEGIVRGSGDVQTLVLVIPNQPVLTATALAYVVAGLWVLATSVRSGSPLTLAGAVALGAVGVGSVAYHGQAGHWADTAHDGSIFVLVAVLAGGALVARPRWRAWIAPGAWFAAALAAYPLGRTDSPLCDPDSLWQWHGVWHVLSAVAAGLAVRRLLVREEPVRAR